MPSLNVRQTKDGKVRYQVRFRLNGSYSSKTFDTETEAAEFIQLCDDLKDTAAALRYSEKLRDAQEQAAMTLDKWFVEFKETRTGIQDRTLIDYQRIYDRHISPTLGTLPIDAITRTQVAGLINALARPTEDREELSAKTIANVHGILAACLNEAVAQRKIEHNPCSRVRLPRAKETEATDARFLTHDEFDRLYAAMNDHYKTLLLTLVGTGMRWAEAQALRVGEVDLDGLGTIKVIRSTKWVPGQGHIDGVPKTKKSRRTIIIPSQVKAALAPLVRDRGRDEYVFTSTQGKQLRHSTFHRMFWKKACEKAKLNPPPRIHDLRHTHASWLLEFGMSLEQVQDQLGHESILTTRKVYGHLQPAMREALQKASEAALGASKLAALAPIEPPSVRRVPSELPHALPGGGAASA